MNNLYRSPLRVYLLLGVLAAAGIWSGFRLPVSLFPNSSKPEVVVIVPFGNSTPEEFLNTYGRDLESQLRRISKKTLELESLEASYRRRDVEYRLKFRWGVSPQDAEKETTQITNGFASRLPIESREGIWVFLAQENSGFFVASFYSETRSLDSIYDSLYPLIMPKLASVQDASAPGLYNPNEKEIRIELLPEVMASLQLVPRNIEEAVQRALGGNTGGSVTVSNQQIQIEMSRQIKEVDDLTRVIISTPGGKNVHLGDVARIDFGPKTGSTQIFKTSGAASLILFATPKPGGNIKKMSEDVLKIVKETMKDLPKDVQYRVLVDPSEFIRSAVNNVFHEVAIAALLAVIVLFLFIGSVRNVVTAAIEIPMSMVLAFILMRWFGININLISLGGLALSAGMNVDGSVVVMENIFRHFDARPGPHSPSERLQILTGAVREVAFPIVASTISSLVVFLPLTFTSDLSYAILGDLAFAVVFSHGFSAIVALILVPTVRLHLMSGAKEKPHHPPIEKPLHALEHLYARTLALFFSRPSLRIATYGGLALVLVGLMFFVLPRLNREIVGIPDTDWVLLGIDTEGNTSSRQMENTAEEIERDVMRTLGKRLSYTFTEINNANSATIMCRLTNKNLMKPAWDDLEKRFHNTPFVAFRVFPFNPSELPIPDPPHLRVSVVSSDAARRNSIAKGIRDLLEEKKIYSRVFNKPAIDSDRTVVLRPHVEQWQSLNQLGLTVTPSDIADISRVATKGRKIGNLPIKNQLTQVVLRFPDNYIKTSEDIGALPIGVGSKLIPLKSLADLETIAATPSIFRIDEQELSRVEAKLDRDKGSRKAEAYQQAKTAITEWQKSLPSTKSDSPATITFEDADKDLNNAIRQLGFALALSVGLIFITLLIQFGNVVESLLVLVAVPMGFIGVLTALFVTGSPLSLNSILGVILLNGIAVANSIILVDFTKKLVASGLEPRLAVLEASQKRLRPILITSLTTILGMVPIALGFGEGGKILQPLGIAVTGGLWVSTLLTLILVPSLHVTFLEWSRSTRGLPLLKSMFGSKLSANQISIIVIIALGLGSSVLFAAPSEPAPTSFRSALDLIVDRSTQVATQRANLEVTRAKNLPTGFAWLPTITGSISQGQAQDFGTGTYTTRDYSASAALNLFRFGSDLSALKAANLEEAVQQALVENEMLKSEEDGVNTLVFVIQSELETKVYQQTSDIIEKLYQVGRERFRQGLLALQESDKISIDLENSRAELRDAEVRRTQARANLRALLGHDSIELDWPWKDLLKKGSLKLDDPEQKLTKRPDWIAGEKRVFALDKRAGQSWGKLFPSLDLSFNYTYEQRDSIGQDSPFWGGQLKLTIPLFDGLNQLSDYRVQVSSKTAAESDFEQIKRTAKKEFESANYSLRIATESAKTRETTLMNARRIYGESVKRFERGLLTANDLANEQNRLITAELLAIKGWSATHKYLSQLCHSLGMRIDRCLP